MTQIFATSSVASEPSTKWCWLLCGRRRRRTIEVFLLLSLGRASIALHTAPSSVVLMYSFLIRPASPFLPILSQRKMTCMTRSVNLDFYFWFPPWFGPCHETVTHAAITPRLHQDVVMRCIVMWGLSSASINSLHDSFHSPEMEINPLKTAFGCPCGGVIKERRRRKKKKNGLTQSSHPIKFILSVCIYRVTLRVFIWGTLINYFWLDGLCSALICSAPLCSALLGLNGRDMSRISKPRLYQVCFHGN